MAVYDSTLPSFFQIQNVPSSCARQILQHPVLVVEEILESEKVPEGEVVLLYHLVDSRESENSFK